MESQQTIKDLNNSLLPKWYDWRLHLFFNLLFFGAALFYATNLLSNFGLNSFFKCVFFFLIWNLIEYTIHRFILHGRIFSKLAFKKEHSFFHHGYFIREKNNAESFFDINRILLRPLDIISLLLLNGLIAYLMHLFTTQETAVLFFIVGTLHLMLYEIIHGLCHTSYDFPILDKVKAHHRLHHDLNLMQTHNFAVILPFMDLLFGTYKRNSNV